MVFAGLKDRQDVSSPSQTPPPSPEMPFHTLPGPPAPANPLLLHLLPDHVTGKPAVLVVLHQPLHDLGAVLPGVGVPPQWLQGGLWALLLLASVGDFI